MKAFCSLLRIVGLLALIGSLAPASDGDMGAALFAAIVGVGLIIIGGVVGKKDENAK